MNAPAERSSALTTSTGWGRWESHANEDFRWIDNDAVIYVAVLRHMEYRIDLHVEPGPSQTASPLLIDVIDETVGKEKLATLSLRGRQRVAFALPIGKPRIHRLRLHVTEPGTSCDGRMLNFRIFEIGVRPIPSDVVLPAAGFGVGSGWGRLEVFQHEFFRWVDNDAFIDVYPGAAFPLTIEVEGGPTLQPGAQLSVVDEADGRIMFEAPLGNRNVISIDGNGFVAPGRLRFHVDGGGTNVDPADPRILNFRAFEAPSTPIDEALRLS